MVWLVSFEFLDVALNRFSISKITATSFTVSYLTPAQLTEGRSARDIPKQPPGKKK